VVYTPPTLAQLRGRVSTDLRDPTNKTFTTAEVDLLINQAVVEVSRAHPKEVIESTPIEIGASEYQCLMESVFRVELFRDGAYYQTVPPNSSDDSAQGGWDLFAGTLHLPWSMVGHFSDEHVDSLRVWGYLPREQMDAEGESLDGDADIESGVRVYAVLTGYQRLVNSRALFQQWTTDSDNTDVSPTQLMGFAQGYEAQWQRIRQQLRLLRRR
jgi:hypothetical protein